MAFLPQLRAMQPSLSLPHLRNLKQYYTSKHQACADKEGGTEIPPWV